MKLNKGTVNKLYDLSYEMSQILEQEGCKRNCSYCKNETLCSLIHTIANVLEDMD